jgi:hypothetical protein
MQGTVSPMERRLRQILKSWVEPHLKTLGFKKRAFTYTRTLDEVWWLIDIQRSRWNTSQRCEFTANLGVYVPGFYAILRGEDPKHPTVPDCVFNCRINRVMGTREDKWWALYADISDPNLSDGVIGRELAAAIVNSAIPFLQRFQKRRDVLALLYEITEPEKRRVVSWPPSEVWIYTFTGVLHFMLSESSSCCQALQRAVAEARRDRISDLEDFVRGLYNRLCSETV